MRSAAIVLGCIAVIIALAASGLFSLARRERASGRPADAASTEMFAGVAAFLAVVLFVIAAMAANL